MEEFIYSIFDFLLSVILFIVKHHNAAFLVLVGLFGTLALVECIKKFSFGDRRGVFEVIKVTVGITVGIFIVKWLCTDGRNLILSQF